jgi:hypothetical protein
MKIYVDFVTICWAVCLSAILSFASRRFLSELPVNDLEQVVLNYFLTTVL